MIRSAFRALAAGSTAAVAAMLAWFVSTFVAMLLLLLLVDLWEPLREAGPWLLVLVVLVGPMVAGLAVGGVVFWLVWRASGAAVERRRAAGEASEWAGGGAVATTDMTVAADEAELVVTMDWHRVPPWRYVWARTVAEWSNANTRVVVYLGLAMLAAAAAATVLGAGPMAWWITAVVGGVVAMALAACVWGFYDDYVRDRTMGPTAYRFEEAAVEGRRRRGEGEKRCYRVALEQDWVRRDTQIVAGGGWLVIQPPDLHNEAAVIFTGQLSPGQVERLREIVRGWRRWSLSNQPETEAAAEASGAVRGGVETEVDFGRLSFRDFGAVQMREVWRSRGVRWWLGGFGLLAIVLGGVVWVSEGAVKGIAGAAYVVACLAIAGLLIALAVTLADLHRRLASKRFVYTLHEGGIEALVDNRRQRVSLADVRAVRVGRRVIRFELKDQEAMILYKGGMPPEDVEKAEAMVARWRRELKLV